MSQELFHKYFIPLSRKKFDVGGIEEGFVIAVPDNLFRLAYNNPKGNCISMTLRLLYGGIIFYRTDKPCIEIFHEQKEGLVKIASEIGFEI